MRLFFKMRSYISQILILLCFSIIFSCKTRDDKVFAATSEFNYIQLYKGGNEFKLLYNGVNTAEGIYKLFGDTIFLTYNDDEDGITNSSNTKPKHANEVLTRKLLIDISSNTVRSLDGKSFRANIYLDRR